jgi:hypothetical protein
LERHHPPGLSARVMGSRRCSLLAFCRRRYSAGAGKELVLYDADQAVVDALLLKQSALVTASCPGCLQGWLFKTDPPRMSDGSRAQRTKARREYRPSGPTASQAENSEQVSRSPARMQARRYP